MKKVISFLLSAVFILSTLYLSTYAADAFSFTLSSDKSYYILTSYCGNEVESDVPAEYNGKPVKEIADGAFAGNISTYKITIPDCITDIGCTAFCGTPSLNEFESSGVYTSVDGVLFANNGEKLISFPSGREGDYTLPERVAEIGEYAFYRSSLNNVVLNAKISEIPDYAFYASSLDQIEIPSNVKTVRSRAFSASSIRKAAVYGAELKEYAFAYCTDLIYADIGQSVLSGEGVFCGSASLAACRCDKDNMSIPSYTFAGCTSLMTAPVYSASYIADNAFYGCASLIYASVKPGTAVSEKAFSGCDNAIVTYSDHDTVSVSGNYTVKVGETLTPDIRCSGEYDLYTDSTAIIIKDNTIYAKREGVADIYAVARKGGRSVSFTVCVNDGEAVLETEHPYKKGVYEYSKKIDGALRIAVTFSSSFAFAEPDALTVKDSNGNLYGRYTGASLAGKTLFLDGDSLILTVNAEKGGSYGFRIVSVVNAEELTKMRSVSMPATYTLKTGESFILNAKPVPSEAFPSELVYISSDPSVAVVDKEGCVTAVNGGNADITAYSSAYGVSASCRVTVNENVYNGFVYEQNGSEVSITYYKGSARNCVIPSKINGADVTKIADGAFAFSNVKTVTVPKTVTYISLNAFDGCTSMTSINVEDGNSVFASEGGALISGNGLILMKVPCGISGNYVIPDTVTTTSAFAFDHCYYITSIDINNVTVFSASCVKYCSSLESFSVSGKYYKASDGVLYYANGKTLVSYPPGKSGESFTVPEGTERIDDSAFNSNIYLKTVDLPSTLLYVSNEAFKLQNDLCTITVSEKNSRFSAYGGILYEGTSLRCVPCAYEGAVNVKPGTVSIGRNAFYGCSKVTSVKLPDGLKSIGRSAFAGCTSLKLLIYPDSVEQTEQNAYDSCENLYVYVPAGYEVEYPYDCKILCGKGTKAEQSSIAAGAEYSYAYLSEDNGITAVTEVNAEIKVRELTDKYERAYLDSMIAADFSAYTVTFEHDGVRVSCGNAMLTYSNGEFDGEIYIFDGGILTGYDSLPEVYTAGTDIILIKTGEESQTVSVLSVKTLPDKLEYNVSDTIDLTGIELYYTSTEGKTILVTDGIDAEYDFSSPGRKTVTLRYKESETSFDVTVRNNRINGTVKISGQCIYGSTVVCDVTEMTPEGATVEYQWYVNDLPVENAVYDSYVITAADIGKAVKVTVTGTGDFSGTLESAPVTADKAKADPPGRPKVLLITTTSVTLEAVEGCEYRMSGTSVYSDSTVFTGLTPGKNYTFYQRKKETATHYASERVGITVTTKEVDKLESDVYRLNPSNGILSLVEPQTTVDTFLQNIKNKENVKVYKNGSEISGGTLVGTGAQIRLISADGEILDSYTVAMTGDVNGDGKISMTDYLQIKERIIKNKTLNTANEYACDVNGDGKITMTDYLRLKYCIQGHENLIQNEY